MGNDNPAADIMVVDDNPDNITLLRKMLTAHGYRVKPALNGTLALKTVLRAQPDLILLDILMPGIDGFEVCRQLQANPQTRQIPIIFVSALGETEDIAKGFALGGMDYITKPLREEEILARVRTHLALRRTVQEKEESRALLDAILHSIPDAIVTVDKNLRVVNSNKDLNGFCGGPASTQPLSFSNGLALDSSPCRKVLEKTLGTGKPIKEHRITCNCMGNTERTLVLNTMPLASGANLSGGAVITIRDISRLADLESKLSERHAFGNIIGRSRGMQKIFSLLERISDLEHNVLITGESGTGKELIADALHYKGNRKDQPLVKVNCAALSENLLESELFGHVKGAFTGAVKDRMGRFQTAEGGTVFLDEIGDISPQFQAKLLRVLEQKEFERIGDSRTIKCDVRIVAATNQDLLAKVGEGAFRQDLYYRLKGMMIHLPPLRERREDIPLLLEHFIHKAARKGPEEAPELSRKVIKILLDYPWAGNIRELKSVVEYVCALYPGETILPEHLPQEFVSCVQAASDSHTSPSHQGDLDKEALIKALQQTDGNKAKTARILGISRGTLYNRMLKYGL